MLNSYIGYIWVWLDCWLLGIAAWKGIFSVRALLEAPEGERPHWCEGQGSSQQGYTKDLPLCACLRNIAWKDKVKTHDTTTTNCSSGTLGISCIAASLDQVRFILMVIKGELASFPSRWLGEVTWSSIRMCRVAFVITVYYCQELMLCIWHVARRQLWALMICLL